MKSLRLKVAGFLALLLGANLALGQQQVINIGTGPNLNNGDPFRTWAMKDNANFAQLFAGAGYSVVGIPYGTGPAPSVPRAATALDIANLFGCMDNPLAFPNGAGGCTVPAGGAGNPGGTSGQIQYNNGGVFGGFTVSGDCTLNAVTGVITCTRTNSVALGSLATATSYTAITNLFSGTCNSTTFTRGDGVCAAPAGSGGNVNNSGTPTNGQFAEWTSATVLAGETMGGDCTLSTATITCTGTSGTAFGAWATSTDTSSGTGTVLCLTVSCLMTTPEIKGSSTGFTTIASANASASNFTATLPAATDTVVELAQTQTLTNKSIAASEVNSGTLPGAQMPALTGDTTSSAGTVATTTKGSSTQFVSQTSNVTLSGTNTSATMNAASGALTVTLPTAVGEQHMYCVTKTDSSANTVTTVTTSSQTIQGNTNEIIQYQGNSFCVKSDNVNWWII